MANMFTRAYQSFSGKEERDQPQEQGPSQNQGQRGPRHRSDDYPQHEPVRDPQAPVPRSGSAPPDTHEQDDHLYRPGPSPAEQRPPSAPVRQHIPHAERVTRRQPRPGRLSWCPVPIGTPIEDFEPMPPETNSYRPDYVADGWSSSQFTVRLAATRGYVHRYRGTPRQDDIAVAHHQPSGTVVFAVADGVSAAQHSHLGATAASRAAVNAIMADLSSESGEVNWQNVIETAAWQLIEQARALLKSPDVTPERAEQEMATTLVAGMVQPTSSDPLVSLVQVGDSSAWVLRDGGYRCLLDSKQSTGNEVVASAVSGLPRVPSVSPRRRPLAAGEVLLVGTDGFGDPLGDGRGSVAAYFAEHLAQPPSPLHLAYMLDFSRETFDDDRTLFALWPRTP